MRLRVLSSVLVPVVRFAGEKSVGGLEVAVPIEDRVRRWARMRHGEQVHSGLLRAFLNMVNEHVGKVGAQKKLGAPRSRISKSLAI